MTEEPLAPWLQRQLTQLLQQRGHALLLVGPAGLGQYPLALALARAWLCEQPGEEGSACGHCPSCHAIDVRTHPDLHVLMPEVLALELGWPLDERTQDKIDKKEIKASKQIRVDATRQAVAFTQTTRSRGNTKVVLVYPAEALNLESANTLLKTLEEPPGEVRFILATEAAHSLLPTIRSRCLSHTMHWPTTDEALPWLVTQTPQQRSGDIAVWWQAAGQRPEATARWLELNLPAQHWHQLPRALAGGDFSAMQAWGPVRQMDVLQKLCHDLMCQQAGAVPRFFDPTDLPVAPPWPALLQWHHWLRQAASTLEHPFSAALMQEAWANRTAQVWHTHA